MLGQQRTIPPQDASASLRNPPLNQELLIAVDSAKDIQAKTNSLSLCFDSNGGRTLETSASHNDQSAEELHNDHAEATE